MRKPFDVYLSTNGKWVEVYDVVAETEDDALAQIPGDFLLYHIYRDDDWWRIEVVRTF